ncbi:MAG: hypothetical protein M1822_000379 [Bathelium mastoideum]|nr:MAG: hypothetical protein M1822_000379 [Bathelium mastoideum]
MLTHHEFNQETTATEAVRVFATEIRGKVIVITGISPGSLGEALALAISSQNLSLLILASRTRQKLEQVAEQIATRYHSVKVECVVVDLSSQVSVREAADQIDHMTAKIDILVNNAAINPGTHEHTQDGIEMQFGVNHVGPFLLTNLLMPKLRNAASASRPGSTRIVNVSSAGHRLSPIRFHDYNFEGKDLPADEQPPPGLPDTITKAKTAYHPFISYGQSKTANVLFSLYLSRSLRDIGIRSISVHPGSIWTNLSRSLDAEQVEMISRTGSFWKTQDQGAAPMIIAAFDPGLDNTSEIYLHECQIAEPARHAQSLEVASNLWALSEQLVGQKFSIASSPNL